MQYWRHWIQGPGTPTVHVNVNVRSIRLTRRRAKSRRKPTSRADSDDLRHFAEEMEQLKARLVSMSGMAENMVQLAVEALLERDEAKASRVIEQDAAIDELELAIDDAAIQLLALQQPMARDLRFISLRHEDRQ